MINLETYLCIAAELLAGNRLYVQSVMIIFLRKALNRIIYNQRHLKIVAVLYPGGEVARNNPDLLGCAENGLGLRDFLQRNGHDLIVLTDKESELDRHLTNSDVLITTPFWPAYITKERISNAPKLRLILTAGVGSQLVEALEKGHLAGYAGDVWYPEPAPLDHPWRYMPNHAMVHHYSGTTLEAQRRYADGIKNCLSNFLTGQTIDREYLIVDNGKVVSPSYSYAFKM